MNTNPSAPKMAVAAHLNAPASQSPDLAVALGFATDEAPLELSRRRNFASAHTHAVGKPCEIDEAAIALVELSVLVYGDLDQISTAAAHFRATDLAVLSKSGRRPVYVRAKPTDPELVESTRRLRESILQGQLLRATETTPQPEGDLNSMAEGILLASIQRGNEAQKAFSENPIAAPLNPLAANGKPLFDVDTDATPYGFRAADATIHGNPHALMMMSGDAALISFRGTQGIADWGLDACLWPTLRLRFRHWGFQFRWQRLKNQIAMWLDRQTERLGHRPTLYLGGHSLGGAVATLAAADLAPHYPIARVVTIGSPRVGGPFFASHYNRLPAAPDANGARRTLADVTTRIVHGRDAITIVPPWPLYVHVGERIHLGHADRVPVDEFTGNPTVAAVSRQWDKSTVWQFKQAILGDNWRFGLQRFALYASLVLPTSASARLLSQLAPILGEAVMRSFLHHKSARYLNLFPVTEIGRGLNRARSFVQPKPVA